MTKALCYIHERGIVHRDLKASNVFISDSGSIVVGDFGIATTHTDSGVDRYIRPEFTSNSELVGPLFWLSPELVAYASDKNTRVDHRSDLFQLGLIIWFTITKSIPRGGLDVEDDPSGGKIHTIVQRLTKQIPDRRYANAAAVLSDLEEALASL